VPLKQTVRFFYHAAFRAFLRLRCLYCDLRPDPAGLSVPLPPSILRFKVSESLSKQEFLSVGEGCADKIDSELVAGFECGQQQRVLDFGCGCGRILRWLIERHPRAEFHGADVDGELIAWCSQHLSRGRFVRTSAEPPLPYPAQYFDFVYCLSVFTHLSEAMQDDWLAELRRILKPDGVLLITVHGLRTATASLDAASLRKLEKHGIVHKTTRKLKGIVPTWYNTTWHSEKYIVARLQPAFGDVSYKSIPDGMQDLIVCKGTKRQTFRSGTIEMSGPLLHN
jgi:ubiquinone/menaquinone biosynthesis C-methylase UbiE